MFYLLLIFKPQAYPVHFNESLENDNNVSSIYKVILPPNSELMKANNYNTNVSQIKLNVPENSPVIIINPIMNQNESSIYSINSDDIKNLNIIDKISIVTF